MSTMALYLDLDGHPQPLYSKPNSQPQPPQRQHRPPSMRMMVMQGTPKHPPPPSTTTTATTTATKMANHHYHWSGDNSIAASIGSTLPSHPQQQRRPRETYVEGVAEEILNGLFCVYEPPQQLSPRDDHRDDYEPDFPHCGTLSTTATNPTTSTKTLKTPTGNRPIHLPTTTTSLQHQRHLQQQQQFQRGILLTPKVITPRPNHGRSVQWIDSSSSHANNTRNKPGQTTTMGSAVASITNAASALASSNKMNYRSYFRRNQNTTTPTTTTGTTPMSSYTRYDVRDDDDEEEEDKNDIHQQEEIRDIGTSENLPAVASTTSTNTNTTRRTSADPPGIDADHVWRWRNHPPKNKNSTMTAMTMQERKKHLNLADLDVIMPGGNQSSSSEGILFDDEGNVVVGQNHNEMMTTMDPEGGGINHNHTTTQVNNDDDDDDDDDESSYYPNRLSTTSSSNKQTRGGMAGLIRFRPPSKKSTSGKDPPTTTHHPNMSAAASDAAVTKRGLQENNRQRRRSFQRNPTQNDTRTTLAATTTTTSRNGTVLVPSTTTATHPNAVTDTTVAVDGGGSVPKTTTTTTTTTNMTDSLIRPASPDAYIPTSALCGFGSPPHMTTLDGTSTPNNNQNNLITFMDTCFMEPCFDSSHPDNQPTSTLPKDHDDGMTVEIGLTPQQHHHHQQVDDIWMASNGRKRGKGRFQNWIQRPKNFMGCGDDQDNNGGSFPGRRRLLRPLQPSGTSRRRWSSNGAGGHSFDSTELREVPSWQGIVENPSNLRQNAIHGHRQDNIHQTRHPRQRSSRSPIRRGRSTTSRGGGGGAAAAGGGMSRSPSPSLHGRNRSLSRDVNSTQTGSFDNYKTPLQRLRFLGRRLSRSPSPASIRRTRSISPSSGGGRAEQQHRRSSLSPSATFTEEGSFTSNRGRSQSPSGLRLPFLGRRGRSESPSSRSQHDYDHKKQQQQPPQLFHDNDVRRARNMPLFVDTVTTPQSSVFSNLSSIRQNKNQHHQQLHQQQQKQQQPYVLPSLPSFGSNPLCSQNSDDALVFGGSTTSHEFAYSNNEERSEPPDNDSQYYQQQQPRDISAPPGTRAPSPLRSRAMGLPPKSPARITDETNNNKPFGRMMMHQNNNNYRGISPNQMSWGGNGIASSPSYGNDEFYHR